MILLLGVFAAKCLFFCVVNFIVIQSLTPVYASDIDLEKEQYWKELIGKHNKSGDIIDLKAQQQTFLAIYNKQGMLREKGSVILLHDKAGHPDDKNVIRPLRNQLAEHGWNTLSIQMPIRNKPLKEEQLKSFYEQGYPRLDSAIRYLKDEQKAPAIFVLAYGSNTQVVLNYFKINPKRDVRGIVLISTPTQPSASLLEEIKLPVLDVYGSRDYLSVTQNAEQRVKAAKRGGNVYYAQRMIRFADHFYQTESNILLKQVHSWMTAIILNK